MSPVEKCQLQVPPTVYFIKRLKIILCNKYVRTYFLSEVHVYLQNVQYLIWTICNHILLIVKGINEWSLKAIKVEQSRWMPWIIKDWRAKWSRVTLKLDVHAMLKVSDFTNIILLKNKRMAQWSSWPRSRRQWLSLTPGYTLDNLDKRTVFLTGLHTAVITKNVLSGAWTFNHQAWENVGLFIFFFAIIGNSSVKWEACYKSIIVKSKLPGFMKVSFFCLR